MSDLLLFSPKEARTWDSIAILWEKPNEADSSALYEIYVDGIKAAVTKNTDETLCGLESDKEYVIQVRTEKGQESNQITVRTKAEGKRYDVTSYGAVGDGMTVNTSFIQKAIDECEPGGIVYVPNGVYITGGIFLKSDMTLYVEKDAVLMGSSDIKDYPVYRYRYEGKEQMAFASLINMPSIVPDHWKPDDERYKPGRERAEHMCLWRDVTICGGGILNANGAALFEKEMAMKPQGIVRGRAVSIRNTDGVYLYDITIRNAPAWCTHPTYCRNLSANKVRIYNKFDESGKPYAVPNADGLNPDSCQGVNIFNCFIESEDDCIAIKSGNNEEGRRVGIPTTDVRISNCRFSEGFGVAMGSEMAGGIEDVKVYDCEFKNSFSLASVKNMRGRGSVIERVSYENIRFVNHSTEFHDCKWFRGAIYVDQFYATDDEKLDVNTPVDVSDGTPTIRDISFRNIDLETIAGNAIYLCGLPERHLKGIVLENVKAKGKYGMKAYNIDGLVQKNVTVTAFDE